MQGVARGILPMMGKMKYFCNKFCIVFCGTSSKSLAQVIGVFINFSGHHFAASKVFWAIYTVTGDFSKG